MITYETTIPCDWCRAERVTGEPAICAAEAERSARLKAEKAGWLFDGVNWLCPSCLSEMDRWQKAAEMARKGI